MDKTMFMVGIARDKELLPPIFRDTLQEAVTCMQDSFAETLEIDTEQAMTFFSTGTHDTDQWIDETTAYARCGIYDYSWQIFRVNCIGTTMTAEVI